ncbi:T6SS immunity protein Tdi1 domain-containing protein [Mesorhizobium japonicum]|uniref:Mlr6569 protein n=1 Tax=Mesorhizobium japonicum (strain LMG 29417 / CECT 9101 / MAFF 303099) TaxID=266835 RepID=Q988W1_RHILO|nr:T6SS immunity protein Tdi1 domain-containing protein [Mesorhizobium japonicum]BAB52836.1 mlr6569 [Mesorhizobium japonicum MAFF 303099]
MASVSGHSGPKQPLEAFNARFGSPAPVGLASSEILEPLPPGFPDALGEYWGQRGFGAYGDQLIWTQPPGSFDDVIEEWIGTGAKDSVLLVRFSFGDFVVWARGRTFFVNVHRGYAEELPADVGFLFDEMLCDDAFLDNFVRRPLHAECRRRLGGLSAGDCFAFVPALALGGTESPESVQKVRMREHLAFLAQVNGPVNIL